MTSTTHPRRRASGIVALVAAGALLLGATPAVAQEAAPDASASTHWSPTTPAFKRWPTPSGGPDRDYYNALLAGQTVYWSGTNPDGSPDLDQSVLSDPSGSYVFAMQEDGDVVLRSNDGRILFRTGTRNPSPTQVNRLVLQKDGNIVVLSGDERPIWSSGTDGEPGANLVLGEDGDLVLYRRNGTPAWSASAGKIAEPPTDTLATGGTLTYGHQLTSENGLFHAVMQRDGNLVGYGPSGAIWSTGTRGIGNRFVIQDDGNAVVYGADGAVRWASGTSGDGLTVQLEDSGVLDVRDADDDLVWDSQSALPGSVLYAPNDLQTGNRLRSDDGAYRAVMQGDGNFVVYGPTGAIWQTATSGVESSFQFFRNGRAQVVADNGAVTWTAKPAAGGDGPFRLVMQSDGNLVEYDGQGHAIWSIR